MDSEPTGDLRSVPVEKLHAMRGRCEHLEAGLRELAKGNLPFADAQLGEDGVTRCSASALADFAQECLDSAPPEGGRSYPGPRGNLRPRIRRAVEEELPNPNPNDPIGESRG